MKLTTCLFALMIALTGCSRATLPYKPVTQPSGVSLSADYVLLADRLRVEVDTDGYRLEDAQITRTDNVSIRPQTIEQPPTTSASGSSFGIGVGGGSFSGGRGGGVGVGTGVLYFPLDQVGQAPWRLTVRVAGATLDIVLLPR